MRIDIACQHTTLTEAMRQAVEQKFSKLDQQTDRRIEAHVVLSVDNGLQAAEAHLLVDGTPHHARVESQDLYQAIDTVVQRLSRSMRKRKTQDLQKRRNTTESLRTLPGMG